MQTKVPINDLSRRTKILILGDVNSIHLQKWVIGLMDEFEISVFSLDPLDENRNQGLSIRESIRVVSNKNQTTNRKAKISYLQSLKALRKLHREFNPDAVHAHYASSYGLLGRLLFAKQFFISVWGSDVFEFPKRSMLHRTVFKWIARGTDKLFSTSHEMAKELAKYTNKQIQVIPFGVDVERFQAIEKKESTVQIIGTIKTLEEIYGIDRLIQASSTLIKEFPNLECHIYGEGSQKDALKNLAEDLGIEKQIHFKGRVDNSKVPSVLGSFDVFCVLSRQESFGVSAVEAQACEIPVVATNVGGLPEIVKNNFSGFTVGENPAEAANKIAQLLRDSNLREQFGKNGRSIVLKQYDWNKNIETLKEVYRSL